MKHSFQYAKKRFLFLVVSFLKEKWLLLLLFCYVVAVGSTLFWGIPNPSHPFPYHMDEWHQLQAVRATFAQGTPNIPGSAHGSMLHYILSGVFLAPFYLLNIVNPLEIDSSIDALAVQERLFILLRSNTLLFGVFAVIAFYYLVKKHFTASPFLAACFFIFTPIWLSLSGYFKYDIALVFWEIVSLYVFCSVYKNPTSRNFLSAAIPPALAIATKLSAVPLLLMYFFSYALFFKKKKRTKKIFFSGVIIFVLIFLLLGIPDFFLGKGDYTEFLYSNLIDGPRSNYNISLSLPSQVYLFTKHYPVLFGHPLYILFVLSILFWLTRIIASFSFRDITSNRQTFFFIFCGVVFFLSLVPLQLNANGNRALVLLPFIVLLVTVTLKRVFSSFKKTSFRFLFIVLIFLLVSIQVAESYNWIEMKRQNSVQIQASEWLVKNVKSGSEIGIENIPIYQMLPDVIVNDYYHFLYMNDVSRYKYVVIDYQSKVLPKNIIVTNAFFTRYYQKDTAKDKLLTRMYNSGYVVVQSWKPYVGLYGLYGDDVNFYLSGLVASPVDITYFTAKDISAQKNKWR